MGVTIENLLLSLAVLPHRSMYTFVTHSQLVAVQDYLVCVGGGGGGDKDGASEILFCFSPV